ncbi:serine hydrolase [Polaribacter porphyrae]|uniref:Beta-lactamase-related domain-containing protein n=1 Tax=Polaribacter porphyrae TaxID=1137780 RepID=A0A2S7WKE9_9FLAO|nr:serine hydrolase [Polaribacter porphyrae]PQJ78085.1 hypothetical protein BTO18_02255 [Polaribacter porphyrae]
MKKFNLIILFISISISSNLYTQNQKLDDIKKIFTEWQNKKEVSPGFSVAIAQNNEVVYSNSFGYENMEYDRKLNKNSVFDMASLAKQFTGFAIAKLILENKLYLDGNVLKYLPELKNIKSTIRLKNLVYHTSGLRDVGELFGLSNFRGNFTVEEALYLIKNQTELNFKVGSEYDYSNTNYVLLAVIVERVTNLSFKKWCHENIFIPLKMKNTFVNDNPSQLIKNRAIAYYKNESSFSYQQNNGMSLIGSSAVYSTIEDMSKWMLYLENDIKFPKVFKLMKTKGKLNTNTPVNYGFGLGIGSYKKSLKIEHSGATPAGFRSQIAIFPEDNFSFVILSNFGNLNPLEDFGFKILEILLDKKTVKNSEKKEIKRLTVSTKILEKYTGKYLFNNEMEVIVSLEEKKLFLQLQGREKDEVFALSNTKFQLPNNGLVEFKMNKKTKLMEANVFQNGNQIGALKKLQPKNDDIKKNLLNFDDYVGTYYSSELEVFVKIKEIENQLELSGTKYGSVLLKDKTAEIFIPNKELASSIIFKTSGNTVNEFYLNRGSRARNLKFKKLYSN